MDRLVQYIYIKATVYAVCLVYIKAICGLPGTYTSKLYAVCLVYIKATVNAVCMVYIQTICGLPGIHQSYMRSAWYTSKLYVDRLVYIKAI